MSPGLRTFDGAGATLEVDVIIVPSWWRVFSWLHRLSPSFGLYLGRKLYEATRRELEGLD